MTIKAPKDKMVKTTTRKKIEKPKKQKPEEKKEKEIKEAVVDEKQIEVVRQAITTSDNPFDKLTPAQIDLIKSQVAKGATDDELKLFITICRNTKLDPFIKQVHFVKRWDSREGKDIGSVQVGIDGFRAIAEDSGKYAGSDDALFRDEMELDKTKVPGQATVSVYKLMDNGERYAFTATARWTEYYPGPKNGFMWKKMPYGQLAKCAEALALRKAFPKLLSGLYAPEEMDQAQETEGQSADRTMEMLKGMIAKIKDVKGLNSSYVEKIKQSKKYNDEQKMQILDMIDKRVAELKSGAKEVEAEVGVDEMVDTEKEFTKKDEAVEVNAAGQAAF